MNDDAFVAKGYEHIQASSGQRLKWAFRGCLNDVEARAYVRTASYAPDCIHLHVHLDVLPLTFVWHCPAAFVYVPLYKKIYHSALKSK